MCNAQHSALGQYLVLLIEYVKSVIIFGGVWLRHTFRASFLTNDFWSQELTLASSLGTTI